MRQYHQLVLILVYFCPLCQISLVAQSDYAGYRLYVEKVKIAQQTTEGYQVFCTLVNTGKYDISPENGLYIEINFDDEIQNDKLPASQLDIIRNLLQLTPPALSVGKIKKNYPLNIGNTSPENLATDDSLTAKSIVTSPITNIPREPFPAEEIPIEDTIIVEKNEKFEPFANEVVDTTTTSLEIITNTESKDPFSTASNPEKEIAIVNEIKTTESTSTKIDNPQTDNATTYFDKNACTDLSIDKIRVLKQSKKWITIEYTITNNGTKAAPIYGTSPEESDNVSIRAYISGIPKLTRGALILGGEYITSGLQADGMLEAKQSFTGTLKLDIRKKTRYVSTLILSVDDFQVIWECNETNNVQTLLLK